MLKKIKLLMDKHINYRMAVVGATLLGVIVFSVNYSYGIPLALTAAMKQAAYTFFVAGFITRNNENLAILLTNKAASLCLAVVISSFLAIGLTFCVHSLKGTPEPLLSTLPTIFFSVPGFLILARRKQRENLLPGAS
jgi:hypothetical protein